VKLTEISEQQNNTATVIPVVTNAPYLRPDEAAKLLGISRRCLSNWQKRRVIAFYRIGRTVIFKRADIEAALSRFRINAVGESATLQKRRTRHTEGNPTLS